MYIDILNDLTIWAQSGHQWPFGKTMLCHWVSSIPTALPLICVHVSSYMDKSWPPWQQFLLSVINGEDVHSKTFYKHFFFLPPCHLFRYQVSNKSDGKACTWVNLFFSSIKLTNLQIPILVIFELILMLLGLPLWLSW